MKSLFDMSGDFSALRLPLALKHLAMPGLSISAVIEFREQLDDPDVRYELEQVAAERREVVLREAMALKGRGIVKHSSGLDMTGDSVFFHTKEELERGEVPRVDDLTAAYATGKMSYAAMRREYERRRKAREFIGEPWRPGPMNRYQRTVWKYGPPPCSWCGRDAYWQKDGRRGKVYTCGRKTCPPDLRDL